jgi:hypothetical protein
MQFMMLNVKNLLLEFGKRNEAENFVHFEEDLFFRKITLSQYFVFFDRKENFTKAKK